jgi:response regulator RpfG family c-di-GMP phosphodiesterase
LITIVDNVFVQSEVSVWTDEVKMRKNEAAASDERSKLMQASIDRLSSENSQMEDTERRLLEELKEAVERGERAEARHAKARGQLEEAVAHLVPPHTH